MNMYRTEDGRDVRLYGGTRTRQRWLYLTKRPERVAVRALEHLNRPGKGRAVPGISPKRGPFQPHDPLGE